ncbi:MAG: RNA polymerase sigma factor [Candidatus Gastranaerophilales bacterium]|nr:RNA polymerase sigma factor [Candidatus Gastranaerophilales bacterium]
MDANNDDLEIISEILNGNVDAYAKIMQKYEAKLHRYVTYLIHDQTAASDVVQETFIKIYQNLRGYNSKFKFSSWAYRIAHNEAMNAIKKLKHFSDEDIDELADYSYTSSTADKIDKELLDENVRQCISLLEPKYREIIQLIYLENMKYEDVSDILHVPTSTVGVWLSRAKSILKNLCDKKGLKR